MILEDFWKLIRIFFRLGHKKRKLRGWKKDVVRQVIGVSQSHHNRQKLNLLISWCPCNVSLHFWPLSKSRTKVLRRWTKNNQKSTPCLERIDSNDLATCKLSRHMGAHILDSRMLIQVSALLSSSFFRPVYKGALQTRGKTREKSRRFRGFFTLLLFLFPVSSHFERSLSR